MANSPNRYIIEQNTFIMRIQKLINKINIFIAYALNSASSSVYEYAKMNRFRVRMHLPPTPGHPEPPLDYVRISYHFTFFSFLVTKEFGNLNHLSRMGATYPHFLSPLTWGVLVRELKDMWRPQSRVLRSCLYQHGLIKVCPVPACSVEKRHIDPPNEFQ